MRERSVTRTSDRRGAQVRHRMRLPILLVVPGVDDPTVHTGTTVDLGRGGCSVVLDEPICPGDVGPGVSVLIVLHARRELMALTGPPLLDGGPSRSLRLTLVPARGAATDWSDLLDELDQRAGAVTDA